ncbi:serine carboxypeptidase [Stylonychia lemnae]|uniref:Serine carboxypeptidase n=1 Tax=Stylonychia lemnae TaxID=5949 RepID=A0A078A8H3_STYLE|nr:serine carboxypeptidase [Stylonychia lemnae]|eukprot:CDW77081.1 serine carboxypeptidase [Stylonychia lemnae]
MGTIDISPDQFDAQDQPVLLKDNQLQSYQLFLDLVHNKKRMKQMDERNYLGLSNVAVNKETDNEQMEIDQSQESDQNLKSVMKIVFYSQVYCTKEYEYKFLPDKITLNDIAQRVFCVGDEQIYQNQEIRDISFFLINDVIYCQNQKVKVIKEYISKNLAEDSPQYEINSSDIKLSELNLKIGFPYLFRHNQSCDHIFIFHELRIHDQLLDNILEQQECQGIVQTYQSKNTKYDKFDIFKSNEKSKLQIGQECQQNEHSITSLPYWNQNDQLPCMYAGTLKSQIKPDKDHNLFYWLFKNTTLDNPNLILWINGGPGSSSMFGLFLENGPIEVKRISHQSNNPTDDFIVQLSKRGSWVDLADVLYLDQPVGVGFSFGDSILDRMDDGAQEFIEFIKNFMVKYPEYQQKPNGRKFYIAGESYSGKYIPLFAKYINEFNQQSLDLKIQLDSLFIGNPYLAPMINSQNTYKLGKAIGLFDDQNADQVAVLRQKCEEEITKDWEGALNTCEQTMTYINDIAGGVFKYDSRIFIYDWSPVEQVVYDFLQKSNRVQELYMALHIEKSTKVPIYEPQSDAVAQAYNYEVMVDYTSIIDDVLSADINVIIFAGEWDQGCGPAIHDIWIKNMKTVFLDYWNLARKIYFVKGANEDYQVAGYYRSDEKAKFTFLTIPKSGHFVPTQQLEITKQIISDYFQSQKLICHKSNQDDCLQSKIMCGYMNQCSQNGVCDEKTTGKCKCNEGYTGADCYSKLFELQDNQHQTYKLNGTQYLYFQFQENLSQGQKYVLEISSMFPFDAFFSGIDNEPNEFEYEIAFKSQTYLQLRSDEIQSLPKFKALVRSNAIDHYSNKFYQNTMRIDFSIY